MYAMWLFVFLCLFVFIQNIQIIPTKHEITYVNPKYIKDFKINIRRNSRESPYYINFVGELLYEAGNNFTLCFESFEHLGGHYVPILFRMEKELCKVYEDPILGKYLIDQLPKNLSRCPVPAGWYAGNDLEVNYENFPYNMPFTYGAVFVRGRIDFKGHVTGTKEPLYAFSIYGTAVQKPRNKQ